MIKIMRTKRYKKLILKFVETLNDKSKLMLDNMGHKLGIQILKHKQRILEEENLDHDELMSLIHEEYTPEQEIEVFGCYHENLEK